MTYSINETHNSNLTSWVESANEAATDFPIQNLPLGVYRKQGSKRAGKIGIAIGESILDVSAAQTAGLYRGKADKAARACVSATLNDLMVLGNDYASALRIQTSRLLRADTKQGRAARALAKKILTPMAQAEMLKPVVVGDYTDFTASIYHATNAGQVFNPNTALVPNYKYVPIAYHGRASSIVISGTPVRHPVGQTKAPGDVAPTVGPSQRFDYELELGFYIGKGNALGEPIPIGAAGEHLFGVCLLNDWSARDIQAWEMQPLGPFLSKNTATTISPWVVTLEALAPFRRAAFVRAEGDPAPLPYLNDAADLQTGGVDVSLEIRFSSAKMRANKLPALTVSRTSTQHLYWTPAQLLAHHTSTGCNMTVGDLFASGTLSGPTNDARGCMLELTWGGRDPLTLPTGEQRRFLEDGDEVIFTGFAARDGYRRIGFGECRGTLVK